MKLCTDILAAQIVSILYIMPNLASINPFDPVSTVLTFPEGAFQRLRKTVLLACANSDQGIIVRYLGSTSRAGPGHTVYACVHERPSLT